MSQPPYPPQGRSDPEESRGWSPPPENADQPTARFGAPGEPQREQTQPFGQPQFGQPPLGQPQFGQPQFGQPPPYGQPPYAQQYSPSPYGRPPYGPPQYGPPASRWGPPGASVGRPPKGSNSTLIALVVAGVVVLAAIGVALFLVLRGNDSATAAGPTGGVTRSATPSTSGPTSSSPSSASSSDGASGIPPAGSLPDGLGDDPVLDQYAQRCYDGDMDACDTLFNDSDVGSDYETYGGTCGGRQPMGNSDVVSCTDAFPS
jgi:hypothetical protein